MKHFQETLRRNPVGMQRTAGFMQRTMVTLGLLAVLGAIPVSVQASGANGPYLTPEQAFALKYAVLPGNRVRLVFNIAPHYRLYRDKIRIEALTPGAQVTSVQLPKAHTHYDIALQEYQSVYEGEVQVDVTLADGARPVDLRVRVQGCAAAGICYPPIERIVRVPAVRQEGAGDLTP